MKPLYFRRDGTPYTGPNAILKWGKDFNNVKMKRVKETILNNGLRVSTVWLGLDHNFGGERPLIFETMVFPKEGYSDLDMDRYSTEREAIKGHEKMVKKWSKLRE